MNLEILRDYCLSLPHTSEKMPFNESVLVFYVDNKMFCLVDVDKNEFINLKCEPEKAIELRASFEEVKPGYHMHKKHWNSVYFNGRVSNTQIKEWIKDSYDLVYYGLTQKRKKELENLIQ